MPETDLTPERIHSLDLLRGLCAIAVAGYHLAMWLGIAQVHTLGLYGVYLFFLLSGASMAVAYAVRFRAGYSIAKYLALRYIRLAPLFIVVASYVALTSGRTLYPGVDLAERWLMNVTFVFGVANPAQTSLVTGGWSLGIEFVFYAMFPLLLAVLSGRRAPWIVAALFVLQLAFVNLVLSGRTLGDAWSEYTQFLSFIGYFAFGVWLGLAHLERPPVTRSWLWVPWLALVGVIATQSGNTAEGTLTGVRGTLLVFACCALLFVTMRVRVPRRLRGIATTLGDASYPMYLLHPIVVEVAADRGLFATMRVHQPARFMVIALVATFALSFVVFRLFEAPILAWGKRRLARARA